MQHSYNSPIDRNYCLNYVPQIPLRIGPIKYDSHSMPSSASCEKRVKNPIEFRPLRIQSPRNPSDATN